MKATSSTSSRAMHAQVALGLALALTSATASAQQRARIAGTVTDEQGNPIALCRVIAHNPTNMPDTIEDVTDDKGRFSFGGVRPGQWTLRYEVDGFQPHAEQFSAGGRDRIRREVTLTRDAGQAMQVHAEEVRGELDAANQALQAGDPQRAVEIYRALLKDNPDIHELHFNLGLALDEVRDYPGAAEAYRAFLENAPEDADAILKLAIALNRSGKTDEALVYYDKTTELDPDNGIAFFNKGLVLFQAERMNDALASFERSLELDSSLTDAYYMIGHLHVSEGNPELALASYENFVKLAPDSPNADAARDAIQKLKQ